MVLRNKVSEEVARSLKTTHFQFGVRYNMAYREDVF